MGRLSVKLRMTKQIVIRESDGATLFLVALYSSTNTQPIALQVIEPPA